MFQKNKLTAIVFSVLVAFGLWLFVVNNVSQEDDRTYYNVPVVLEGESILNERNLMITQTSASTVALRLSGSRSDLNKIGSSNSLTVRVDVSKISEPGERIALNYTPVYPGDVSAAAVSVQSRTPASIYLDVDYRRTKELPIQIRWTGARSEDFLYDTENAVLDYTEVIAVGPATVVDQIDHAEIEVDLSNRVESISETYRYTLVDANGEPVDAQDVSTNLEEVRLDMPIRRIREVRLAVALNYGGGADERNTLVSISPEVIRVSGSEAVLEELGDVLTLGTIHLAEMDGSGETTFAITLPEGVTNQTGITEATVTVRFLSLMTREFTIDGDQLRIVNLPEGLEAEIITASLQVKLRGPNAQIDRLTAQELIAEVDLSAAEVGTATYKATIVLPEFAGDVGAMNSYSVSAQVRQADQKGK